MKRRIITTTCGLVAVLAAPLTARAHHVVSETGLAWAEPVSVVETQWSGGTFDFGQTQRGHWQTLSVRGQWAPTDWVSLALRTPWSMVRFEDGRAALGLGDVETTAQFRLAATPHGGFICSAGVGVEWPTGVAEDQLGGGHVEVAPFVIASSQLSPHLILTGVGSLRASTSPKRPPQDPADRAAHGSVLSPHTARESTLRLDLAYVKAGRYYGSVGAQWIHMFAAPQADPVTLRAEGGWLYSPSVRVALGAQLPVRGESRGSGELRLNVAYMF